MAGTRIKGITIDIEGNTTKLTDSLKAVDKQLAETQTALKDVNKLLKMDPGNVDLLKQKQKLLGDAVSDTKKRLEELQKAYDTVKSSGDTAENQKQQDALQREIIETTSKLKDLEKQYNQCSPALESISAKTGQLSEKTAGLSKAAGIAAAGMVGMAVAASSTADELLTDARVTGFTVEALQKLQYAAELVDVSYETMTGSITKLTKNMASGSKAFDKLGVSVRNENGQLRDANDVWYETVAALGQIENETERDAISMEIFGKSAMEMAGIVDDGGTKLKELGEEAEAAGVIMSEDAVQGAGEFNDALEKLKATAAQSFASAGATLAESLLPTLEKLVEVVSDVLSWFANLDGTTQTVILTVLALAAAISPVLGLISTLTGLAAGLNVAMLPMLGTIALIIAAVAAVIAIGVLLYKNWDTIKEKAQILWQNIKDKFEKIKNAIVEPIEKAKDKVGEIIDKIRAFFRGEISFPHIKLPHFGIEPPGWKIGDLLKGSIPKLGIEWYAKAMDGGMILDKPTIFGMQNGSLLAGGEKGAEVVVGKASLLSMIKSATAGAGDINVNVVVNGNVDDYDAFADVIGQHLAQQMAKAGRAFR